MRSLCYLCYMFLYVPLLVEHLVFYSFIIRVKLFYKKMPHSFGDIYCNLPEPLLKHYLFTERMGIVIWIALLSYVLVLILFYLGKRLYFRKNLKAHIVIVLIIWICHFTINPFMNWMWE